MTLHPRKFYSSKISSYTVFLVLPSAGLVRYKLVPRNTQRLTRAIYFAAVHVLSCLLGLYSYDQMKYTCICLWSHVCLPLVHTVSVFCKLLTCLSDVHHFHFTPHEQLLLCASTVLYLILHTLYEKKTISSRTLGQVGFIKNAGSCIFYVGLDHTL